jgi:peptide deformylase
MTAAGRQATATDSIHRPVSRPFFFSLTTFDEKTTELHLHAEKLTETVLHLNLGHLVGFFFLVLCSFVLFYVTPLMRQLQNNI